MSVRYVIADATPPQAPAGVPPDLVFASSWSTDTGTSNNAVLDQGRTRSWQGKDNGSVASVITTPGTEFPSDNCLSMPELSEQFYATYTETSYFGTMGVGDYTTLRFMFVCDNNLDSFQIAVQDSGGQNSFSPSATPSAGTTYEVQTTAQILTGPVGRVEIVVYSLDSSFNRTLLADTEDYGLDVFNDFNLRTDSLTYANSSLDLMIGYAEEFDGGTVHPFWMADWNGGGSYSNQSLIGWNFGEGTDNNGDFRASCVTVCKGQIGNREWPLREWTTAEESWTP